MNITTLRKINKLYFGYEEIARALGIKRDSARVFANRYVRQGLLVRVKRNLYLLKDVWARLGQEELFSIANTAQVPSYVSLASALGYYDIYTQIQRNFVESVAVKRTKEITTGDTVFNYTKIRKELYFGFVKKGDFFIADPEKALLDALYLISLKRYSFDLSSIDFTKIDMVKLKRMSKKFPKNILEALGKYGYIEKA